MVIIKISDGLGNQFFQYALGRNISYKNHSSLKLDLSAFNKNYKLKDYQLDKYKIIENKFTFFEKIYYKIIYKIIKKVIQTLNLKNKFFKNIYWEKEDFEFNNEVFNIKSKYFFGYWQNARYFQDIKNLLLEELTLKKNLTGNNASMLQNIKKTNSISLHIRRGDYLKIKHQNVCNLEYYQKAILKVLEKVTNPCFFIFSDDIEWAKENLIINYQKYFIDFNQNNPEFDLELMKNCKHNIISNSTFSWWGTWLNTNKNKTIIMPKEWKKDFPTPNGLILKNGILI